MRRLIPTLVALVTAIVVAAGCGNDEGSASGAASVVPADAIVYGEATLHPDGDKQAALDALAEKFPGEGGAGGRLRALIEKAFAESDSGLSYEDDVEPWLGDEAAYYLTGTPKPPSGRFDSSYADGDGAVLVATDDEGKAMDAVEKGLRGGRHASYKGHDYVADADTVGGVVDGWLVLGSKAGFEAVVDTAGDGRSIEDSKKYDDALADAPSDRLGFVYVNLRTLFERMQRSAPAGLGALPPQARDLYDEPFLFAMDADADGFRFEGALPAAFTAGFPFLGKPSDLTGGLPADSWLALGQADLGKTIDGYLDLFASNLGGRAVLERQFKSETGLNLQKDVLSWMGDWGVFVRGSSVRDLDGALIIETSDERASRRFIDWVAGFARGSADRDEKVGPLRLAGGGHGITLRAPELSRPVHLFQRDRKVVAAYGDAAAEAAIDPARKLGDTQSFADAEAALGGGYSLSFYMAVEPVLALVQSVIGGPDPGFEKVKPYLEPLAALVSGTKKDGDKLRVVTSVTVK